MRKWIDKKYRNGFTSEDRISLPDFDNKCPECGTFNDKPSMGLNWGLFDCLNKKCNVDTYSDVGYYLKEMN